MIPPEFVRELSAYDALRDVVLTRYDVRIGNRQETVVYEREQSPALKALAIVALEERLAGVTGEFVKLPSFSV